MTAEQKQALENKLVAIDDSSSNQIAVVIIPSLDGYPKEEYATKLFRDWGIGNKKTNNGILLLIAINDRQIRIEVGYGLEGALKFGCYEACKSLFANLTPHKVTNYLLASVVAGAVASIVLVSIISYIL